MSTQLDLGYPRGSGAMTSDDDNYRYVLWRGSARDALSVCFVHPLYVRGDTHPELWP